MIFMLYLEYQPRLKKLENWRFWATLSLVWLGLDVVGILPLSLVLSRLTQIYPHLELNQVIQIFIQQNYLASFVLINLRFVAGAGFLAYGLKIWHKQNWVKLFSIGEKFRWLEFAKGILLFGLIWVGSSLVYIWMQTIFGQGRVYLNPSFTWLDWLSSVGLMVVLTIIQAGVEEYISRIFILDWAFHNLRWKSDVVRLWSSLVVSTLFFVVLHFIYNDFDLGLFFNLFVFGMNLGLLAIQRKGIEMSIAGHMVNNLMVLLLISPANSFVAQLSIFKVESALDLGVWKMVWNGLFYIAVFSLILWVSSKLPVQEKINNPS
jgi:membrane protease YdiL (CAAX protease family)